MIQIIILRSPKLEYMVSGSFCNNYEIHVQLEKYVIYQIDFKFLRHLSAISWEVMSNAHSVIAPKR